MISTFLIMILALVQGVKACVEEFFNELYKDFLEFWEISGDRQK